MFTSRQARALLLSSLSLFSIQSLELKQRRRETKTNTSINQINTIYSLCQIENEARQMHAKNRLPSSGHTTPSPPASPRRSPRYRHTRGKGSSGRFTPGPGRGSVAHRLAWLLLSVLLRRQGIFLFAPLIYISGMLLYMGTVSFDVGPIIQHRPAPGSVYRSPQVYLKLKPEMDADNSTADAVSLF